jgi:hypothetical protein
MSERGIGSVYLSSMMYMPGSWHVRKWNCFSLPGLNDVHALVLTCQKVELFQFTWHQWCTCLGPDMSGSGTVSVYLASMMYMPGSWHVRKWNCFSLPGINDVHVWVLVCQEEELFQFTWHQWRTCLGPGMVGWGTGYGYLASIIYSTCLGPTCQENETNAVFLASMMYMSVSWHVRKRNWLGLHVVSDVHVWVLTCQEKEQGQFTGINDVYVWVLTCKEEELALFTCREWCACVSTDMSGKGTGSVYWHQWCTFLGPDRSERGIGSVYLASMAYMSGSWNVRKRNRLSFLPGINDVHVWVLTCQEMSSRVSWFLMKILFWGPVTLQ